MAICSDTLLDVDLHLANPASCYVCDISSQVSPGLRGISIGARAADPYVCSVCDLLAMLFVTESTSQNLTLVRLQAVSF